MSIGSILDDEFPPGLEDEPPGGYTTFVIVEVYPLGDEGQPIIHDIEIRSERPLSTREINNYIRADVLPWLGTLANYADFVRRFGTEPRWKVISEGTVFGA